MEKSSTEAQVYRILCRAVMLSLVADAFCRPNTLGPLGDMSVASGVCKFLMACIVIYYQSYEMVEKTHNKSEPFSNSLYNLSAATIIRSRHDICDPFIKRGHFNEDKRVHS